MTSLKKGNFRVSRQEEHRVVIKPNISPYFLKVITRKHFYLSEYPKKRKTTQTILELTNEKCQLRYPKDF